MSHFKPLEDYGVIGNLSTICLVGSDGSIDWGCFPHIESPSLFGALLDIEAGGRFWIRPADSFDSRQAYIDLTNVLQTTFELDSGAAVLTDFMPIRNPVRPDIRSPGTILRRIESGASETVFDLSWEPRFDYGRLTPRIDPADGGAVARANGETCVLRSSSPLDIEGDRATARFTLEAGKSAWFACSYGDDPAPLDVSALERALEETVSFWRDWAHDCEEPEKCVFGGPWHDMVVRSGLVLKLLTHEETGAIAAAPTTSLPERIGGERNWDYRYSWIRDSSFTVQALYNLGHVGEARAYLRWLMEVCRKTGDPADLRIVYGLHGEDRLEERTLDHLSGYRNSRPVRIGNGAAGQRQLDIYGELVGGIYETTRYGETIDDEVRSFVTRIADHVCGVWNTPDAGIWEFRAEPRHFVYSKLMCWVALDRARRISRSRGDAATADRWDEDIELIREAILRKGYDEKIGSFVQSFGSSALDATSLLVPITGFLPADDPRVRSTIDVTMARLTSPQGFVYRYLGDDGIDGSEGVFILCTFWLIDALTLSNRTNEARDLLLRVLDRANPLGLLAEEIDPSSGAQLGNFPQAFSHIGLINSSLYLGRALGKRAKGPAPAGAAGAEP